MTPNLVTEFNAVIGADSLKRQVIKYDCRVSSYGIHFVGGDPDYIIALEKAGFIQRKVHGGWMATKKGRLVCDALKLHEGSVIILTRNTIDCGHYKMVEGSLQPVIWQGGSFQSDLSRVCLVWRGSWQRAKN